MIVLHRITPFGIALLLSAGFFALIYAPFTLGFAAIACFVVTLVLFARLLLFDVRRTGFWVFLGMPFFLLLSSLAFFLLLEQDAQKILLAVLVTAGITLYAEALFTFYHLPRRYQAYSLEYLSLILAICGLFFTTSATYLAQIFLEAPVFLTTPLVSVIMLLVSIAVFWVSKIAWEQGRLYALVGALFVGEVYLACSWLPTGYTTNAAVCALFAAWYFGIMRAHAFSKLTRTFFVRHTLFLALLIFLVFITTPWR